MDQELKTLYEDDSILVFDKPSGLVVNKSMTTKGNTLQDFLETKYSFSPITSIIDPSAEEVDADVDVDTDVDTDVEVEVDANGDVKYLPEDEFKARAGIVHRLDKDTSGVLVVAKTLEAFVSLQKQFKGRKTKKEYVAILHGIVTEPLIEINAPIKRSPKNPMKLAVVAGGREAFTEIEKVKELVFSDAYYTMVKVFPKTGRTHQIRVHTSAISHPVAGDVLYCSKGLLYLDYNHYRRLMLHAASLQFHHPSTHQLVTFTSPLPSDFNVL